MGKEHKFWNIRYKRKHKVQMFLTKNRWCKGKTKQ